MKRIITILTLLTCFGSLFAQSDDTTKYVKYPGIYGLQYPRLWANKVLRTPLDTIYSKSGVAILNHKFYYGDGILWRESGSSNPSAPGCGLTSGGIVTWTGVGLNFYATASIHVHDGVSYSNSGDSIILDAADGSFGRFDAIGLTTAGLAKVTGAATSDPQLPQFDPCDFVLLTYVFVGAGATTPTQIADEVIYDENTETWSHTTSGTISTNFAATTQVFHLTKSLAIASWSNNANIIFTAPGSLVQNNYTTLSFWIRLTAVMVNNQNISIQFFNGTTAVSNQVVAQITKGNTTTFQSVSFNMSQFTFTSNTFTNIHFVFSGSQSNATHIDWVRLQAGITQPPTSTGIQSAYARITDGTNTATAIGSDVFKFRAALPLRNTVTNNDATHGDNLLQSIDTSRAINPSLATNLIVKKQIDSVAALAGGSTPTLTQYYVGVGDASNLLSGTNKLQFQSGALSVGNSSTDDGVISFGYTTNKEVVSVSTPSSGYGRLYAKNDGKVYYKNSAGTDYDLTAGGSNQKFGHPSGDFSLSEDRYVNAHGTYQMGIDSLSYFFIGTNPATGVNFYDYTTGTNRFGITSSSTSFSSPNGGSFIDDRNDSIIFSQPSGNYSIYNLPQRTDTTANKIITWNATTKKIGYSNFYGSSGGSGTINSGTTGKPAYYVGSTTLDDFAAVDYAASGTNMLLTTQNTTDVGLNIKAQGSQTANLLNISSSSGTGDLGSWTKDGYLKTNRIGLPATVAPSVSLDIQDAGSGVTSLQISDPSAGQYRLKIREYGTIFEGYTSIMQFYNAYVNGSLNLGAGNVGDEIQLRGDNGVSLKETSAPATPSANRATMYVKSDGLFYGKDDAGVETKLSNDGETDPLSIHLTGTSTLTGAVTVATAGFSSTFIGTNSGGILSLTNGGTGGVGTFQDIGTNATLEILKNSSNTNGERPLLQLTRATLGTAGDGIAGTIDLTLEANDGSQSIANQIIWKYTTAAVGTRTSQVDIKGVNSAVSETFINIQTGGVVRVNNNADTLATKAYARSVGGAGSGETNTASNLGGGLANYSTKVGVDLRFNSFDAADFDLASNLISIDATKWLTISAGNAAYQGLDADLTYLAGFTPSANVKTILNAADYSAVRTALGLVIGTNVQAWDADLDTYAGLTPTTVGQNLVTLTNPSAISFLRVNADNTVTARSAANFKTDLSLTSGTDIQAFDADLTTWAGITPGANVGTFLATPSSANLRGALTDENGTGAALFSANSAAVFNAPTIGTSGTAASSHITSVGSVPTVSQTGAGSGGSVGIAFETGSTDAAGIMTITTGNASVGSSGTITLTFNSTYSGNQPAIVLTLVKGATDWGALATIRVTTQSLSAPVFTWNNSATGAAVALTANTTYKVAYMVIQK